MVRAHALPVMADGLIVLDEFYELMLHLIAQSKFPDVSALTHDESDEIFLDVRPAPQSAHCSPRRDGGAAHGTRSATGMRTAS